MIRSRFCLSLASAPRGALLLATALIASPGALGQTTERVSLTFAGGQANGTSSKPCSSADGRYVAFMSLSNNLVTGTLTNGWMDVFLRDRETGTTEFVSVDSSGNQANSGSEGPVISEDGRYVAFRSNASNLVAGDTNSAFDIFVRDRQTGSTQRVSVSSSGAQALGDSDHPAISADGRYVAFDSNASNLVAGDVNGTNDVFVHDLQTGVTKLVSVDSSGNQTNQTSWLPAISGDGRYVAFSSTGTNLVPGDTNSTYDIFVHDLQTGSTQRVSVDSSGVQANSFSFYSEISEDGRSVAFESNASNLVVGDTNFVYDIFVHDLQTGVTQRVSVDSAGTQGNQRSDSPAISADGRYVAFQSYASNLVAGDTNNAIDVFLHDRLMQATERSSLDSAGNQGNSSSTAPAMSPSGRHLVFESTAANLVAGDTNGVPDIFLRDRCSELFTSYCTAGSSASGCQVALSASGVASSSASSGFTVTAAFVEGQKDGLFFFGQNGRQANSWGNGTSYQCVVPPVKRAGILPGNGTSGACDQLVSQDLNARWCPSCPKPNHAPVAGLSLQIQYWYRDPLSTSNQSTSLSSALEVTACP